MRPNQRNPGTQQPTKQEPRPATIGPLTGEVKDISDPIKTEDFTAAIRLLFPRRMARAHGDESPT